MLENFMNSSASWSVVTEYIARQLCRHRKDFVAVPLQEDLIPKRTTYLIYYRYSKPWIKDLTQEFIEMTRAMLSESEYVELLNIDRFLG